MPLPGPLQSQVEAIGLKPKLSAYMAKDNTVFGKSSFKNTIFLILYIMSSGKTMVIQLLLYAENHVDIYRKRRRK
jgi:hypothetical protein